MDGYRKCTSFIATVTEVDAKSSMHVAAVKLNV